MNYEFMKYNLETLKPNEVIVYLRKSRSDDPLLSVEEILEKHETILDEWAMNNLNEKIPETNKYREIVSGETLKERPEINKVLHQIESPKIKAICVIEPQRLTRGDLEEIGRLMKLLKHTHTFIITPQKIYNLHDEYDWDIFERELKRGNDYLEYTKKILNRGRLLSVSQGNFIGSIPPYGYDKIWIIDGKRKCPTLTENKEQADVVRMIFDLYVNKNMGRTNICNQLDNMKIKPPKGEYWSPAALKDMLENIHYIGKVKWNWRKTITIVEDSEIIKTRPKSKIGEFLIYDGKHEGIISEQLFYAAQEKQGKNYRAKAKTKIRNPLAGLLYCKCGKAMSLKFYKKPNGSERCSPRLICDGQKHCQTGSCLYEEMIHSIIKILEEHICNFEIQLKNHSDDYAKRHTQLIQDLEKKLKLLQAKELAQWEAQSDPNPENRMPQEIFKQLNVKLLKEKEEIQQALSIAYETMPITTHYEEKVIQFREAVFALNNSDISAEVKNKLLKHCIERIDYIREKPERLKGKSNGLKVGGNWSNPPFKIDIKLKI